MQKKSFEIIMVDWLTKSIFSKTIGFIKENLWSSSGGSTSCMAIHSLYVTWYQKSAIDLEAFFSGSELFCQS